MDEKITMNMERVEALTERVLQVFTEVGASPTEGFFALSAAALILSRTLNGIDEAVTLPEIQAAMDGIQGSYSCSMPAK